MTSSSVLRISLRLLRGRPVRAGLLGSILTVALAGWCLPASASAAPLPRIDMKVLLLGTSTTEPDYQAWQAALQREGIPFDSIIGPTASRTAITASTLSDTLPRRDAGGQVRGDHHARSVADGLFDGTCVSDLSSAESSAIETYEQNFAVRQITGDVYPGTSFGLNTPDRVRAFDAVPDL